MIKCDEIICDINDEIAVITLNRPEKGNCLNRKMRTAIGEYMDMLAQDKHVKAVIIQGNGKNFCVGGDIAEMSGVESQYQAQLLSQTEQTAFDKIQQLPMPVIAVIQGACMGAGFDMALSCDFRLAAADARIGFPEITIGIVVGGGGVNKLIRHIGLQEAKEMLFTARILDANEALEKKLVNKILQDPHGYAVEFSHRFLNISTNCIAEYKKVLYDNNTNYGGMILESNAIARSFGHQNRAEGISAFLEKRNPHFT